MRAGMATVNILNLWPYAIASLVFALARNALELNLQAYQWGWKPLQWWPLVNIPGKSGFIPADSWHWCLVLCNLAHTLLVLACFGWLLSYPRLADETIAASFVLPFVTYAIGRAIAFSIPLKSFQKKAAKASQRS